MEGCLCHRDSLGELGAHEALDYNKVRFEDMISDIDIVLDTVGGDTLDRSCGVLRRGGTLVSIVDKSAPEKAKLLGVDGRFFIVEPNRTQLIEIGQLIDTGRFRPFLDTVLPLNQAQQAFERGLRGHSRGKIVLHITEQAAATA